MPLYEFICNKCQHQFEALIRKSADEQELVCPKCDCKKVTKTFSTFATGGREKGPRGAPATSACGSCSGGTCATCH